MLPMQVLPFWFLPTLKVRVGQPSGTEVAQFLALIYYRFNRGHADILQHIKMREIGIAEGHPETGTGQFGEMFGKGLKFLMIHIRYMLRLPTWGKSKLCLWLKAGVSTQAPSCQCRAEAVTSRILISGLKLVAKCCPWSPPLQSRISNVCIFWIWCLAI